MRDREAEVVTVYNGGSGKKQGDGKSRNLEQILEGNVREHYEAGGNSEVAEIGEVRWN